MQDKMSSAGWTEVSRGPSPEGTPYICACVREEGLQGADTAMNREGGLGTHEIQTQTPLIKRHW